MSNPTIIPRAIEGAASAPLTRKQKRDIVMLAGRAWAMGEKPYFDEAAARAGDPLALSAAQALELWRHEQQHEVCGHRHLTSAAQRDYAPLCAHFMRLAGMEAAANAWTERAAFDPERQARAVLNRVMERARISGAIERPEEYVRAIAHRQFRTARLEDLTAHQIWSLTYTIRSRTAARLGTQRASRKGAKARR